MIQYKTGINFKHFFSTAFNKKSKNYRFKKYIRRHYNRYPFTITNVRIKWITWCQSLKASTAASTWRCRGCVHLGGAGPVGAGGGVSGCASAGGGAE